MVTEGYKNKEIAQIYNFTKKLGVKNNTQALIIIPRMKLIKIRAKTPSKDVPVMEITSEGLIDDFRNLISGETRARGVSEKDKQYLKV